MDDEVDGPRIARPEEFPELLSLVDRCFNDPPGGMQAHNPHCYDESRMDRHAIIKRDGVLVSHIACIPNPLIVDGVELRNWGLSGVATDPRHRGNGYMGQLIDFWLDRMDDADVPVSILWGDRIRYGHFGWETAGRVRTYTITDRSFDSPQARDGDILQYDGSDGQLDRITEYHRQTRYRVRRDRESYRTRLGQRGLETLLHGDPNQGAYLAFTGDGREKTVTEVGGHPRGVRSLLAYLFEAYYTTEVQCPLHPRNPLHPLFVDVSIDWELRTHKKLNIRRLEPTLSSFTGLMERRWSRFGGGSGDVTIGIEGDDSCRLSWSAHGVTVEPFHGEPDLSLGRRALTRLLFGFPGDMQRLKEANPFLDAICPLEFYIPRTDWV